MSIKWTWWFVLLQHKYWASSDSLLVILCWYRLLPNSSQLQVPWGKVLPCPGVPHCSPGGGCCPHSSASTQMGVKPGAKLILHWALCKTTSLLWTFSLKLIFPGAVRNSWAAAEPPVNNCLRREHLSMTTDMHGQVWSSREPRRADLSPLPPLPPCSTWLSHCWVICSLCHVQRPSLMPPQSVQHPKLLKSHPAILSRREKRLILHAPAFKPHVLHPALL